MGRIFPPTLAEWHSAVIGFYVGFVYGASRDDDVAATGVERVIGFGDDAGGEQSGHLSDTREEAAYAGGLFLIGVVIGSRWKRRRPVEDSGR